jgi:HNH/ENDO VII superfamily nuclease with conserved GHE residues
LTPPQPSLLSRVKSGLQDAGDTAVAIVKAVGQAVVDDPGAVLATAGGAGLMVLGGGGEAGGVALDLTGVGAVAGVPINVVSGGLIATGAGMMTVGMAKLGEDAASNYRRPSGFRKGVRQQVYDENKGADGAVRDPKTQGEIKPDDTWDMGHKPGYEFRKHQDSAAQREIDRKQFLDEHNNPNHYRPETPNTNRSHTEEDHSGEYKGPR